MACGCLKILDGDLAEVKRVFVCSEKRSKGIAKIVVKELEKLATENNVKTLILQTGIKQKDAINLYKSIGYTIIGNYGPYMRHNKFSARRIQDHKEPWCSTRHHSPLPVTVRQYRGLISDSLRREHYPLYESVRADASRRFRGDDSTRRAARRQCHYRIPLRRHGDNGRRYRGVGVRNGVRSPENLMIGMREEG